MHRSLSLSLRSASVIALWAAAALASAQDAAPRHIDESVWSEFVYERIGATPNIRLGRSAPVRTTVAAQPGTVALKPAVERDFDLGAERSQATSKPAGKDVDAPSAMTATSRP